MKSRYAYIADGFKALGDENRLRLLEALGKGEQNAGELLSVLNISQPTLSHHMKLLCDTGIVESRKDGKWTYYKISNEGREELLGALMEFTRAEISERAFEVKTYNEEKKIAEELLVTEEFKESIKEEIEDENKELYEEESLYENTIDDGEAETEEGETLEEEKEAEEEVKEDRRSMPSWLF